MKYLLVVNPISGGGREQHRLSKALRYFQRKGDLVTVYQTQARGDATSYVREHAESGWDAVIAAGGDGTLREVMEGLLDTRVPLGILPWGTGNVFARELGLPRRIKALCRRIRKGKVTRLDLGMADGRPFLMMLSVGFDAYALNELESKAASWKRRWGVGAYVWAALGAFLRYPHPWFDVELADGTVDRGSLILVLNTRLYGAFFTPLPHADPTDGTFDVLVYRHRGRWPFLGMMAQLAWKAFLPRSPAPGFLRRHGVYRTSSLHFKTPGPAQIDGDPVPSVSTVLIRAKGLSVLR